MTEANPVGAPPKYKTAEEMEPVIDEYFAKCDARKTTIFSKTLGIPVEISDPEPYTVAGLSYALDINRKTLIEYSKKDEEFCNAIKRAKLKIEAQVERRSMETPYATGCIFNLKNNFDYKDSQDHNIGGQPDNPLPSIKVEWVG